MLFFVPKGTCTTSFDVFVKMTPPFRWCQTGPNRPRGPKHTVPFGSVVGVHLYIHHLLINVSGVVDLRHRKTTILTLYRGAP